MLASWLSNRTYTLTNARHQLDYGWNTFSHALEKKTEAALILGVRNVDYIPKSLQRELFKYYAMENKLHVMEDLRFEYLYPGVPAWTLNDGVSIVGVN